MLQPGELKFVTLLDRLNSIVVLYSNNLMYDSDSGFKFLLKVSIGNAQTILLEFAGLPSKASESITARGTVFVSKDKMRFPNGCFLYKSQCNLSGLIFTFTNPGKLK